MVKSITPALILVVAVFGISSNVTADASYLSIVSAAVYLAFAAFACYFLLLEDKETGCNADEMDLSE